MQSKILGPFSQASIYKIYPNKDSTPSLSSLLKNNHLVVEFCLILCEAVEIEPFIQL